MERIFGIEKGIRVPDGTVVYLLLNAKDTTGRLPGGLLEDFSLAAGKIKPGQRSKIHVMPLVTQATFVLQGRLEVRMKDPDHPSPYSLRLKAGQAVLTRPGTFLQFINHTKALCRLLYIVRPAYIFVKKGRDVVYDDSIILGEDWLELERVNWQPDKIRKAGLNLETREQAAKRLVQQGKGKF